jgi:hypothetical protein
VRVRTDATATQDIDLLLDTRKYLSFTTTMQRLDTSLLGIFQKVDKTFALRSDQKYTAVNAAGFEIDVIRRMANGRALLEGHPFTQTVVATNGAMATMSCPPPDTFVRIKTALGQRADRDPLKARKDLLQARVVQALLDEHGLQYLTTATA